MSDSDDTTALTLVLAATVLVATSSAGFVAVTLPALFELLGVDALSSAVLTGAASPFVHALLPLCLVYIACKRAGGIPLPPHLVAGVSLFAAVVGRYVGTAAGYASLGREVPGPLVLVSAADLAAREFGVVLWVAVVVGVLGAGLWGAVGALGGIGAFRAADSA